MLSSPLPLVPTPGIYLHGEVREHAVRVRAELLVLSQAAWPSQWEPITHRERVYTGSESQSQTGREYITQAHGCGARRSSGGESNSRLANSDT
eukprot:3271151-Pyramimonas_sp.AAC.1